MKQTINFSTEQKIMVLIAMDNYRSTLNGLGQRMFDIAYNKIKDMKSHVDLDGMEMIYVTQALRYHGKALAFKEKKRTVLVNRFRIFADQIEDIRKAFQTKNNPMEKAASAETLTA
ncbi:hypothetical protein ACUIJN_22775 [Metabacillus halosaccharovorans]|uniref:hypothetical protein n=1 Tax=Metabacillus halosaccharovorans TaxID=930124 RepID=UPI00403DAD25